MSIIFSVTGYASLFELTDCNAIILDLEYVGSNIYRMHCLGMPQDRIAKSLGATQASIHNHLLKMATLPNLINAE